MASTLRKRNVGVPEPPPPASCGTRDQDDLDDLDFEYDAHEPSKPSLASLRSSSSHVGERMPSRLRNFLVTSEGNISCRLFTELLIRYPAQPCARADIEALVESFGAFEYLNEGPKGTHTHVVRFINYEDAIKCYLQLNGAFVDPKERENAITEWRQLVETELESERTRAWRDENPEAAEQLRHELRSGELLGTSAELQIKPVDENERMVFITCDFFRAAFYPPRLSKAALLTAPSMRIRDKNPLASHAVRMTEEARMFSSIYGLIKSHGMHWDDYIFCVNYLMFFQGPGQNLKEDAAAVALKGLIRCRFDVTNFLAFVDSTMVPHVAARQGAAAQLGELVMAVLQNRQAVFAGLALAAVITTIVSYFVVFRL